MNDVVKASKVGIGAFCDDSDPSYSADDLVWFDGKRDQIILVEGSNVLSTGAPWNKLNNIFAQTFYLESSTAELMISDGAEEVETGGSCGDVAFLMGK